MPRRRRGLPVAVAGMQRLLRATAGSRRTDGLARATGRVASRVRAGRAGDRALRGGWLGHALHPMLTDFTNGPWMAASFLDLFGPPDAAPAARRLVGLGLVSSVPTLLSGLSDWDDTRGATRRVGALHATTSTVATCLYAASYLTRRRGAQSRGVALGVLGGIVAFADGYVGGELSLVARAGTGRRLPTRH
jgi:hypothetical protein